jgi:signal transduction histidine kinase
VQLVQQLLSAEAVVPYHSIEDPAKLRRVLEATLLIEADLDLPTLLRHIVDEACTMANARYGALGVLNHDRTALSEFVTVGIEPDEEARIGPRPTGLGILGLLIDDPRPLRITHLNGHPESHGFPSHHPPMTSFLGVPIKVRDEVYGNLYLTEKIGWAEFTSDDEVLIGALAVAAGIAIENARLHERVTEVAIYEERDRLARDLHDTVIQRLFAIGLSLQSMVSNPTALRTTDRLTTTIEDIDDTIRQVRTSIFELGSDALARGARESVLQLLTELRPVVGFDVHATFGGPVDSAIPDIVLDHLLAVLREAVTNIGRHARATHARVEVEVADGSCCLRVIDDGCGIGDAELESGGLGLGNLRRRAEKLHGQCTIESLESGGTAVSWVVPVR